MAGIIFANRAGFLLASSITASSLSFNVQPGTGSRCPEISGGNYAYMVFKDASGNFEVVRVTGHAAGTDVFTLASTADRGLDGTTARAWLANDAVRMGLPRLALWDIMNGATTDLGSIGGTANAITAATPTGFDAHRKGNVLRFIPILDNTDAPAISLGGRPPRAIYDGLAPAGASALKAGRVAFIYDDGTQYQLINPANLASLNNPVFTGDGVTLPGNAVSALHAVPKQQLDAVIAALDGEIDLIVPALTGSITAAVAALEADRRGTVFYTTGVVAPSGAIIADGSLVSRTGEYADLFAAVSASLLTEAAWVASPGRYSSGNLSTTFRIPKLTGIVIRGYHAGSSTYETDIARGIGSYQADEFKAHTHTTPVSSNTAGGVGMPAASNGAFFNNNTLTGSSGGAETRMKNVALIPCIWL